MSDTPLHPAWRFEPCDPEGQKPPATAQPWEFAVRGVRPAKTGQVRITGYGQSEPAAESDAQRRARTYDAQETLGLVPGTTWIGTSPLLLLPWGTE